MTGGWEEWSCGKRKNCSTTTDVVSRLLCGITTITSNTPTSAKKEAAFRVVVAAMAAGGGGKNTLQKNETKLHCLLVDEILRKDRLLFAFIDGCSFGAGYVVATVGKADWAASNGKSDMPGAKAMLHQSCDWRIHDISSVPLSLNMERRPRPTTSSSSS